MGGNQADEQWDRSNDLDAACYIEGGERHRWRHRQRFKFFEFDSGTLKPRGGSSPTRRGFASCYLISSHLSNGVTEESRLRTGGDHGRTKTTDGRKSRTYNAKNIGGLILRRLQMDEDYRLTEITEGRTEITVGRILRKGKSS